MHIEKSLLIIIFSLFACFYSEMSSAQNSFGSEQEMIKQAKQYFDAEDYIQAYPIYSRLLSLYPQHPEYNYRFGVCMLLTTPNKEKPISYLEKAAQKSGVDNTVFYFLGKAYHLIYRFDDAISNYNIFKRNVSSSQAEKYNVDMEIKACYNGKQLLHNISELVVIDKKEVNEAEFYRSYDLSGIGGKLLVKIDEFKSPVDKKKKDKSIIYLAKNNEIIYYSSYGADGKNGRDIYYVEKQPGGQWSKPKSVGTTINTSFDEDYPFLHPNGKVLYFCSKGHNSMGGYDVFKSVYDPIIQQWSAPRNLDFPINSPDDDILFVTDSLESTAFFSSSRSTAAGTTAVYRINTERKPTDIVLIKGNLVRSKQFQKMDAKVTVKNAASGEIIGVFNADPVTGEYVASVPNGGKFVVSVEADGFSTQSDVLVVPFQNQMRPIKQEVIFDSVSSKMTIKNVFDESGDDSNYLTAINYIREKAKLDINFTESVVEKPLDTKGDLPIATSKPNPVSNEDIIKIANEDAKESEKEYLEIKSEANYALVVASEKNDQALKKEKEAKQVMDNAKTIQDPVQRQAEVERAEEMQKEVALLQRNTVTAYNVAQKLENDAKYKKEEADRSDQYAKDLANAIKSANTTESLAKLEAQKSKLESMPQKESGTDDIYSGIKSDYEMKKKELDQAVAYNEQLKNEIPKLETELENTKKEAAEAKNENLKAALNNQAQELENDIASRKKELEDNKVKVQRLAKEAFGMKESSELVGEMMTRMKTNQPIATEVKSIDRTKLEKLVSEYEMTSQGQGPVLSLSSSDNLVPTPAPVEVAKRREADIARVEEEYSNKLSEADKITDESKREDAKAAVYKEWSAAIDREVKISRQDFQNETDEAKKAEIVSRMSQLQESQKEKEQLSLASSRKVEELKQQPIAQTEPVSDPASRNEEPSYSEAFKRELQSASSIENEVERENAKAVVYKMWSDSLSSEIARNRTIQEKTTDPSELKRISERIDFLENKLEDVKKTENIAKTEQVNQIPVPENVPGSEPIVSTPKAVPEDATTMEYSSPGASSEAKRANVLIKESNDLKAQAITYRQQAANSTNETEQKYLSDKAVQTEQESQQKQLDAEKSRAAANRQEIILNNDKLEDLSFRTVNQDATNLTVAALLREEGKTLFDQALKERAVADSLNSFELKEQRLNIANKYEQMALNKQKKATDIYMSYNPGYKYDPLLASKGVTKPGSAENQQQPVPDVKENRDDTTPVVNVEQSVEPLKENNAPSPSLSNEQQPISSVNENTIASEKKEMGSEQNKSLQEPAVLQTKETLNKEASNYKTKADEQTSQSQALLETIDTVQDGKRKAEMLEKIKEYDRLAQTNYATSDSITKLAETAPSENKKQPDVSVSSNETAIAENRRVNTSGNSRRNANRKASTSSVSSLPLSEGEVFERKRVRAYSKRNPIPVDAELPEGVIFKVQIGAFRNPIEQGLFEGISPISGEKTAQGFIRYTAGIFKKLESAKATRDYIRNLGYPDAFVVAFYNGKRVSVSEAQAKLGISGTSTEGALTVGPNVSRGNEVPFSGNGSDLNSNNGGVNSNTENISEPNNSIPIAPAEPAKSEKLNSVGGLFYTVQVGVFAKPVSSAALNNIQPLYNDETENGNIRYYTGIYTDIKKASMAKRTVIGFGISDAFVVAYYQGKRIRLEEAKIIESTQGNKAYANVSNSNTMPTGAVSTPGVETQIQSPAASENNMPAPSGALSAKQSSGFALPLTKPQDEEDSTVVYKIQIGAFDEYLYMYFKEGPFDSVATVLDSVKVNEQVPVELANKYFNVKRYGLKSYKDINGLTIYTLGENKTFSEAQKMKEKVIQDGIKDAFIVAYRKGKKITLKEARQRTNE